MNQFALASEGSSATRNPSRVKSVSESSLTYEKSPAWFEPTVRPMAFLRSSKCALSSSVAVSLHSR